MATYKFKLYPSATLKAKVLPAINSEIVATNGLQVSKEGGVVTVEPDYGSLAVQSTVVEADRDFVFMPAWNSLTETHTRVPVQTFIDGFGVPLQAIAGLTPAADKFPYFTSTTEAALATITSFGRSLVDDADAATALTTLGVSTYAKTILDDADAATALATLGASYASQAEAETGTATNRSMSPQRVRDYLETGDSFLQSGTGAAVRALRDKVREIVSVKDFGATGDGSTDDAIAIGVAIDTVNNGGLLYLPPGKYKIGSAISKTIASGKSMTIMGAGADVTTIYSPDGDGITINYTDTTSSFHLYDLSITTGTTATGVALDLVQGVPTANPANSAQSDIVRVTIRGDDGYAATDYWAVCIRVNCVSNINFVSVNMPGTGALAGNGVELLGSDPDYGVQYNFFGCVIQFNNVGLKYGDFIQGVALYGCNFTGGHYGIVSNASEGGVLDQLSVCGCQFANDVASMNFNTKINGVLVSSSVFIQTPDNANGINGIMGDFSIIGNQFRSGTTTGTFAVVVAAGSSNGVISGNTFTDYATAVFVSDTSNQVNVQSNGYIGNTVNTSPSSTTGSVTIGGGSA